MTEPAGGRIVLRRVIGPAVCVVVGLGFLVGAVTVAVNISSGIVLGLLGAAGLIFGLSLLLSVTEVQPGRLIIRSPGRSKAVLLDQLASAEIIVLTFRGSRTPALQLRDQQGTTAVLSPGGYPRARWQLALVTLAPYIMAPEVQRTGQIADALAGTLWRRR
jgi:hypothetical protein